MAASSTAEQFPVLQVLGVSSGVAGSLRLLSFVLLNKRVILALARLFLISIL